MGGKTAVVFPRLWLPHDRYHGSFAVVRVTQRCFYLLVQPGDTLVVAPIRVSGRRLCCRHERSGRDDRSVAKTECEEPEQPNASPVLQRILLFASDPPRAGV